LYFAVFLIVLGIGNIIFGYTRVQVYTHVYTELETLSKNYQTEIDSPLIMNSAESKIDQEKLESGIRHAKARLDFYKLVEMGGKSLLVLSALLILYCFYYSKDFDKKPVLMLLTTLASFSGFI
jgi:hypothetical protein